MTNNSFQISGVDFTLVADGIVVHCANVSSFSDAPAIQHFVSAIPSLLESGLVEPKGELSYFIPAAALYSMLRDEVPIVRYILEPSPYGISIESRGSPGLGDFRFEVRYRLGSTEVAVGEFGPALVYAENRYLMGEGQFQLVSAARRFNALPELARTKEAAFTTIAEVKRLAAAEGARVDRFLQGQEVVVPSDVGLGFDTGSDGRITAYPTIEGVADELMRQGFLELSDVQPVYDLARPNGGRIRVVMNPGIQEICRDIQRVRRVGGYERDQILSDPTAICRDGTDRLALSSRVKGLTDAPLRARLAGQSKKRGWFGVADDVQQEPGLIIRTPEGSDFVAFETRAEFDQFARAVADAKAKGEGSVSIKGRRVFISDDVEKGIDEIRRSFRTASDSGGSNRRAAGYRYIDIYLNEEALEYVEGEDARLDLGDLVVKIPASLKSNVELKRHQKHGIAWLQYLYQHRDLRKGCLLADDMGLGKTLQILTFLASLIEELDKDGLGRSDGPYDPVLIVAPVILHSAWEKEMDSRFKSGPFENRKILHGSELRKFRAKNAESDVALEKSTLDLDRLRRYRFVITNYETVRNYPISFANINWSVIVVDEGQEIKEQNQTSTALKALKADFKIVATGTPVENHLLDLWNLFDFAQPGSLLGTASEFRRRYESGVSEKSDAERQALGDELRNQLRYNGPDAYILRREKSAHLPDLKRKEIHFLKADLSAQERAFYSELIARARQSRGTGEHLKLFHDLRRLSDHPVLYRGFSGIDDIGQLVAESPKLGCVLTVLREIRRVREKVLVFTDSRNLQNILQAAFKAEFGLVVSIVNGDASTGGARLTDNRNRIIEEFEAIEGFNILILSPHVAGVGLTIVGANHVIHYSRWWNPAKEAQATDRVYRIGQEKDVHVYYPILTDPAGKLRTFDETLNELLEEKAKKARDFLVPTESLSISEEEIVAAAVATPGLEDMGDVQAFPLRSADEIAALSPSDFEVAVALLLQHEGYEIIVNGRPGDCGIDVFAANSERLLFVQVKHSSRGGTISDSGVVEQLMEGAGYYYQRLPTELKSRRFDYVAFSNADFDKTTARAARNREVELRNGRSLVKAILSAKISLAAIRIAALDRVKREGELQQRFLKLVAA